MRINNILTTFLSVIFLSSIVLSQSGTNILTNTDIIGMSKAGIPESVIIAKIDSSDYSFRTEIDDLKKLLDAGVSEKVITYMVKVSTSKADNRDNEDVKITSGSAENLKGLTKIYIETNADLKERERIEKRLNKANVKGLEIVDDLGNAEIILVFGGGSFRSLTGVTTTGNVINDGNSSYGSATSTPTMVTLLEGEGRVFVISRKSNELLLVLRVQNMQESRLEKRPVTKFVNEFVETYKEVNGLK